MTAQLNNKKLWLKLIFAWTGLSILVLLSSLFLFNGQKESEVAGTLTFIMFILSFPSGWLSYALATSMLDYFAQRQMYIYDNRFVLFLAWALFFGIGCFQWSILGKVVTRFSRKAKKIKPSE